MKLTLASASPRRVELIKKLDYLEVTVKPSAVNEIITKDNPREIVMELAEQNARAVCEGELTLGADTMVFLDDAKLGKPKSVEEAYEMFRRLCGRTHSVITGVCLTDKSKCVTSCEESFVTFAPYDDKIVTNYVQTGKPFDKAGGYGLQDSELASLIKEVTGDYDNVLGLPVRLVDTLVRENFT